VIAVVVTVLLRLIWTIVDVTAAGVCYWLWARAWARGEQSVKLSEAREAGE
jgi:hypothetical protein